MLNAKKRTLALLTLAGAFLFVLAGVAQAKPAGTISPQEGLTNGTVVTVTGTGFTAGKTLGTDLQQQKLTLPLIHTFARLPADEAAGLRKVLGNGQPKRPAVAAALARTGAVEYARERAEALAADAAAELGGLPPSESLGLLRLLTKWAVKREK